MAQVRSPFNFVPLNHKVFYPDWADQITQDIPFADGLSGAIDVTITAESPIFVRNGHTRQENADKCGNYQSFSKYPDGTYYIPGTTVKGAIRSVLEVLSYGKMQVDKNAMFAHPHLDSGVTRDPGTILCGWLKRRTDGTYYISVCKGKPKRIALWEIDSMYGCTLMQDYFSKCKQFNLNKEFKFAGKTFDPKTAEFKYALLQSLGDDVEFEDLPFTIGDKDLCTYDENSDFLGTVVLTGQPGVRNNWNVESREKGKGKWKEFVFPSEIERTIPVDEELFDRYKSLYQNSTDWKFRMKSIDTSGIPVFFRESKGKLLDMGLTYMYRVPYAHTPSELVPQKDSDALLDMAECMFGYTSIQSSLRGRVQFSNFTSLRAETDVAYELVLNGPKASYYPLYVRQDNGRNGSLCGMNYQTYDDGQLAGRKRYLLRNSIWTKKTGSDKLDTTIYPLKKGAEFTGTIHFHNLRPEELGALLSAITFHENPTCYHQIGQAKPYGFGKVSMKVSEIRVPSYLAEDVKPCSYYVCLFEQLMKEKVTSSWLVDGPLKELFTLSSQEVKGEDAAYQYMEMSTSRTENEFVNVKEAKSYLQPFSQLSGKSVLPESRLAKYQAEFDKMNQEIANRIAQQKAAEKAAAEAEAKAAEEAKKANEIAEGLRILEAKKEGSDDYKVTRLQQVEDNIKRWNKKAKVSILPPEQCDYLWITLQRLHANPDKKDKRNWADMTTSFWKGLIKLTPEGLVEKWFNELNKGD